MVKGICPKEVKKYYKVAVLPSVVCCVSFYVPNARAYLFQKVDEVVHRETRLLSKFP